MHPSRIGQILLGCSVLFSTPLPVLAERELHVVGIHAAVDDNRSVQVHVNRPNQTVTLFLSAYNPLIWNVSASAGTTIERVFLSGYHRQTLQGLPASVPVISSSYDEGNGYLYIGYDIDSTRFIRSVPLIEEQTGQKIASFHGGYQSVPPGVIIDAVQNDPRLSSDYPQPVPLSELPEVEFDVTTYEQTLRVRHYGLDGPDDGGPLLEPFAIADADATGRFYYEGSNGLAEIDSQTGARREIPLLDEIVREGWQMGTAFDRKRNRALLVTLSGEGFLYGYSPAQDQWTLRTSMQNRDVDCIVYHDADDSLYAATLSHEDSVYAKVIKLTADGAFVKDIPLPILPFNIEPGGHRAELVSTGKYLVLLLVPGRYPHPDALPESRIYLIDPSTSEVWLTYRLKEPPNQLPLVALDIPHSVDRPRAGTVFPPGTRVRLGAQASDRDGTIASVEFFVDNQSIGLGRPDPSRGYVIEWTTPESGSHDVVAKATDNRGGISLSAPLTIVVDRPPVVRITAPADGIVVDIGTDVVLTATAQDPDGSVASVIFNIRGSVRTATRVPGTDTYTATWPAEAAGSFSIQAIATDNLGAFGESESIQITVQGPVGGSITTTRFLPPFYVPERRLTVVIIARPSADVPGYLVVDRPPAGWTVHGISGGGRFDALTGTVTFGPFPNTRPRALFYRTSPPSGTTGPQRFSGSAIINGVPTPITGASVINSRLRPRPQLPPVLRQPYE